MAGVFHLCADRAIAFNMYQDSGQTEIKKVLTYRDKPPYAEASGMPCGTCWEFLLQLSIANKDTEIMADFTSRESIRWSELCPSGGAKKDSKQSEKALP